MYNFPILNSNLGLKDINKVANFIKTNDQSIAETLNVQFYFLKCEFYVINMHCNLNDRQKFIALNVFYLYLIV